MNGKTVTLVTLILCLCILACAGIHAASYDFAVYLSH